MVFGILYVGWSFNAPWMKIHSIQTFATITSTIYRISLVTLKSTEDIKYIFEHLTYYGIAFNVSTCVFCALQLNCFWLSCFFIWYFSSSRMHHGHLRFYFSQTAEDLRRYVRFQSLVYFPHVPKFESHFQETTNNWDTLGLKAASCDPPEKLTTERVDLLVYCCKLLDIYILESTQLFHHFLSYVVPFCAKFQNER